jgi:hypothetical protein
MTPRTAFLATVLVAFSALLFAQQPSPPASSTAFSSNLSGELDEVRDLLRSQARLLEDQRRQIERQQQQIDELRDKLGLNAIPTDDGGLAARLLQGQIDAVRGSESSQRGPSSSAPHVEVAVLERPVSAAPPARPPVIAAPQQSGESGDRPLSVHFGRASLTPGGWVDLTGYYRSRNVGSGIGTSFATIPYSDTVQGGLSEAHLTAANSRITLRADESFGGTRVFGYGEADFNGVLPGNAYVSTNSSSLRLRVFFADIARGRWEVLGGQSWSLMTPNRVAISPFLSEIYNTLHLDTNYQVGLTYARQTQLRAAYHFPENIELALSAENPQQYSGSAATFPALFSTSQTDTNSSNGTSGGGTSTPTLHPDLIAKLAWDPQWLKRHWHLETSGLLTPVAILTPETVTKDIRRKDVREGGGVGAGANLEVAPSLHLIMTGFWSDGGGRYIGGLGPGFVVAQHGSTTAPFEAQLVHSGSGVAGAEWRFIPSTVASLTFSAAYFGREFSTDPSTGKLVGYGFTGSANSNNRMLQEATFASQTTLWKQAGYGSVQMITQSSWIMRAPWYHSPGTLSDAHVFSGWANLRYVLP